MIVKNEAKRIVRCLESVVPYIDCYAIVDTGSTDATTLIIEKFFEEKGIPGIIGHAPFENWSQARNAALGLARRPTGPGSLPNWDYLLFCDADMQLVVIDEKFREKLTLPTYCILQQQNGISYWNTRLVSAKNEAIYIGVTHEYFDAPVYQNLTGVIYQDHGDGSNREGKFKRDIALLSGDLDRTQRSWFYMAQSLKDDGQIEKAAQAYATRASMGGWDEETWYARLQYARLLRQLGDEEGFVKEAMAAYDERPSRAEPLYDLANHNRLKGKNNLAIMFAEAGMAVPYPNDLLFVEDFIYKTGLKEEYSIAGFYDDKRRARAFAICNSLALDPTAPGNSREMARQNLFHYIQPLAHLMPSFQPGQIAFTAPDGYRAMNPSVTRLKNKLVANVRCVNYNINEHGGYDILGDDGSVNDSNPIHTRNFLVSLNDDLSVIRSTEILPPSDLPTPKYKLVIGFEDLRIFSRNGELYGSACVRQLAADGLPEQVLSKIVDRGAYTIMEDWKQMLPAARLCEKNWMPIASAGQLSFMYRLGEVVDETGKSFSKAQLPPAAIDHISGGSQLIKFNAGWLALVHESRVKQDGQRYYQHRFVWFDHSMAPRRLSLPFVFDARQIEFACGLAHHPDGKRLVMSYGLLDKEAWIATVTSEDVVKFLWKEVS